MKPCCFLVAVVLFMAALMAIMIGCDFDVTQPRWYQPPTTTAVVTITGIDPVEATPGVNFITIHGTNFTGAIDTVVIHNENVDTTFIYNGVYFDKVLADAVEFSATSIKVRRPNLVSNSCIVKVVSNSALLVAKSPAPYRIDAVLQRYGSFLENVVLAVVAVDREENLYVVETGSKYIYKIATDGDKTNIGTATRVPTDASIGPDGNLYLPENNRAIDKVEIATGAVTRWTQLPSGKVVKFGDFGNNGYFYTGGTRTDLVIVPFDLSTTPTSAGFYANDEILAIRFCNGYIYVVSRTSGSQNPAKIWRHLLDATGKVGSQELVLDMSTTGDFSSRMISAIAFSSNGTMYIATDSPDPILVVDPATNNVDFFYKDILPSNCKQFGWGNGTYLYMISGDTNLGQEWTVYRVDMGTTGAP